MSLTNPNTPVSQQDLQDFYHRILPYLGGSNEGGSGHTIEDAEGTSLTQRDTLQFGEGFSTTDDPTNEKTIVDIDSMSAEDMDEIINELPTGGNIAVTGYVPLGTLIPFYGETAPKFFLACDGSTYNKVDYPELANHLLSLTNNTPYIVDGDNTKFKVPDLRGEFLRGTGTNSYENQGSGGSVGEHQDGTEHTYLIYGTGNSQLLSYKKNNDNVPLLNWDTLVSDSTQIQIATATAYGEYSNRNSRYTSRPTNTSVLYCIAYKDIYSNPMNDYSTTEKVVGTWIDGKPVYQKTIQSTVPTVASGATADELTNLTSLNIDALIMCQGVSKTLESVPTVGYSSTQAIYVGCIQCFYNNNNKNLYVRNIGMVNDSAKTIYVTIQYTKTTDAPQ